MPDPRNRVDYDAIAGAISPDQLAHAIGAKRAGPGTYRCPTAAHANGDRNPSLSISRVDGRTVCMCHGCGLSGSPVQVAAEVWGMAPADAAERLAGAAGIAVAMTPPAITTSPTTERRIVATYDYTDEEGNLLFQVTRFDPKDFRQRRPDGNGGWTWKLGDTRRVLYRLPELEEAIALLKRVFITEGEKDADAIVAVGGVATTCPGGAGKWRSEYTETFRGAEVIVVADRDDAGRRHAQEVADALQGVAADVQVVHAAGGKDAADHLAAGYGLEDFVTLEMGEEGAEEAGEGQEEMDTPVFITLQDLYDRPELLTPPEEVVPFLAHRGRGSLFASREKLGKSTFLAHAVSAKSRGTPFLGRPTTQGRVIWAGLEEALGDAVRRFQDLHADPMRILLTAYGPKDLYDQLRQKLKDWPADLLVVDSLSEFARISLGKAPESGDAAGWGAVIRPLVALAREFSIAVVILHHASKATGNYRDSTEIGAAPDAILEMTPPTATEDPNLRHIRGTGRWHIEPFDVVLTEGQYHIHGGEEMSLEALLLIHIQQTPGISLRRLQELVQRKRETVITALHLLESRGAIERRGKGSASGYYPASPQALLEVA